MLIFRALQFSRLAIADPTASVDSIVPFSPSGNAIFQGRDKDPETLPSIQSADCRDKMRARIAANSGRFALNREIPVCAGLRGGLGGLELLTKRLLPRRE
jgi:hypothetical protein